MGKVKKKAIAIYLENKPHLMLQFGCLYTSLKFIHSKDTDLVVFGTRDALKKVPDDCIRIEHEPVSSLPEWRGYHFINSIECLTGQDSKFLMEYDLLLRSDVDTFLTPAWKSYQPNIYTTGIGGYVNDDETRSHLKRIAGLFKLKHRAIHNIGSTQFGEPSTVRKVCKLSLTLALHIINKEFTDSEGKWPGWYKGVTSLYALEIATNHLVKNCSVDSDKLDHTSTSRESVLKHPHIHCWHTNDIFSKYRFESGDYDHLNPDELNLDEIRDYCLYIALKSKREMPWLI